MHQPEPAAPYREPTIAVGSQKVTVADKFVYLGSNLSRSASFNEEVTYRVACASASINRLHARVSECRGIG